MERIYIRLEDPSFPFAMGILIPSIAVESADKVWNIITHVLENPSIMYKRIIVKGISIFLERDPVLSSIDEIIKQNNGGEAPEEELLEVRLREHINYQLQDINSSTSFMLRKFNIDVRFHMVIDNVVERFENPDNDLPDIML